MLTHKREAAALLVLMVLSSIVSLSSQITIARADSSSDARQFASNFLESVIGFNNFTIVSIDATSARTPGLRVLHIETTIRAVISANNSNFEALMTLVDGKLWTYYLDLPSDAGDEEKTPRECLDVANRTMDRYQQFFNIAYCGGFVEMIPQNPDTPVVETNDTRLEISYQDNYVKYVLLQWFRKIRSQYIERHLSVSIEISKSGLTTLLVDGLGTYSIGAMDNITKQEAINIATPYVETYSQQHGQEISSTNATLAWIPDQNSSRRDSMTIYPIWDVLFGFDKTNYENMSAYYVAIWADNGEVYDHGPLGPRFLPGESPNYAILIPAVILAVAVSILILGRYAASAQHRKRKATTAWERRQ